MGPKDQKSASLSHWRLYSFCTKNEHSLTEFLMLQNFGSTIGKSCFRPISSVTIRFEHIGDETINNLIMKRVVCLSSVQNVGTNGEHQNDQVFTQRLFAFLKGEYNEI